MSFEIPRGDTRTVTLTLKNADGTAFDFTSNTEIKFMAKRSLGDADGSAIFNKTCTVSGLPTAGICTANIVAADIAVAGIYFGEVQTKFANGDIVSTEVFEVCVTQDANQS